MLLGLMFDKLQDSGLSRKHFAIAKVRYMRELNILAQKSSLPTNYRTQPPHDLKVEIIDYNNLRTQDSNLNDL